jgi:hypothetical protein
MEYSMYIHKIGVPDGGAELISPERADSDSAASPTLAMETLPSQGQA